jgi:prepilin peptidase CpaA
VLSIVWLLFAGILMAAVVIDLMSYRIPNSLVVALLALFIIIAATNWTSVAWLSHVGAGILVFGAGIFLYAIRQMGAGDVKLLGVVALWAGVFALPALLFFVSICGLLGMLVIIGLRIVVPRVQPNVVGTVRSLPRVLSRGQGIPYAIGIGPGALIASYSFAPWLWRF